MQGLHNNLRRYQSMKAWVTVLFAMLAFLPAAYASEKDYAETKAKAEQGNAAAEVSLGHIFRDGQIAKRDPIAAAKWFYMAAQQGFSGGQANLADSYSMGRGVLLDYEEAYFWYSLAIASSERLAVRGLRYNRSGIGCQLTAEQ